MKNKSETPKREKAKELSNHSRTKEPQHKPYKKSAAAMDGTPRPRGEANAPADSASRGAKVPTGRAKGFAGAGSVDRGSALTPAPLPKGEGRKSAPSKAEGGKGKHARPERPAGRAKGFAGTGSVDRGGALTPAPLPKGEGRKSPSSKLEVRTGEGRKSAPSKVEGRKGISTRPSRPATAADKPLLRSGQVVELHIEKVNDEGFGTAHLEGTRVLVSGGLPGEALVAKITYVGRREAFANIVKLLKPSSDRVPSPACSMGRACDGCGLIQMRYPAQLAWKKELVTRHIARYPSLSAVKIHDTIGSPRDIGYRNTAKLVVAGKHSDPVIGIYRRNTHDVLEIENCALHHPLINKVVKAAKAGIKKGKVQIYNPKSEMGLLRYLVVRVAEPSDQVMVVLVTTDQGYNEMHHLAKFIQKEVPEVAVVAQNINTSSGNVIFGNRERFVTKAHTLKAFVGDKVFHLSPHSFFQVNSGTARIIYEKVRDWAQLSGEERVLDVYCGIGGISLYLADRAEEVMGIEYVEAAVADATINAALNRATNCRFEAGDAAHLVEEMAEEGGADLVVLNPPRKGCDEKVLKSVAAMGPQKIIYVSCSPETLARDLDMLSRLGYRTLEVQPVDMFPQTVHVENVARIEKI